MRDYRIQGLQIVKTGPHLAIVAEWTTRIMVRILRTIDNGDPPFMSLLALPPVWLTRVSHNIGSPNPRVLGRMPSFGNLRMSGLQVVETFEYLPVSSDRASRIF